MGYICQSQKSGSEKEKEERKKIRHMSWELSIYWFLENVKIANIKLNNFLTVA